MSPLLWIFPAGGFFCDYPYTLNALVERAFGIFGMRQGGDIGVSVARFRIALGGPGLSFGLPEFDGFLRAVVYAGVACLAGAMGYRLVLDMPRLVGADSGTDGA